MIERVHLVIMNIQVTPITVQWGLSFVGNGRSANRVNSPAPFTGLVFCYSVGILCRRDTITIASRRDAATGP
jgi:hypothetical protein